MFPTTGCIAVFQPLMFRNVKLFVSFVIVWGEIVGDQSDVFGVYGVYNDTDDYCNLL